MTAPAALELRGVTKTFADGTIGLHGVDLVIAPGELVAVVGPSGAGKSTLLNILGLLDRATSGEVVLAGQATHALSESERDELRGTAIGFVFQSSYVLGEHDALANVALAMRINGVPFASRVDAAHALLATVGLEHRAETKASLLSGGERQRLAIARALSMQPGIVLADEPTGNLDSANGALVLTHLRAAARAGTTVVIVTHDDAVAAACDRVIRVVDGQVTHNAPHESQGETAAAARSPRPRHGTWADTLADVANSLSARAGRAALLVLAFALGVGGMLTATGASETAAAQVSTRLTAAALDEVRAFPRVSDRVDAQTANAWVTAATALPHVRSAAVQLTVNVREVPVQRTANARPTPELRVIAGTASLVETMGARVSPPHATALLDGERGTVVLLGRGAADRLGIASAGVGTAVWVGGRLVPVVGIVESGREDWNNTVIVSLQGVAGASPVASLIVRTDQGYPAAIAEALPIALDAAEPGRFRVETVADLRAVRFGVASDLDVFVTLIGAVLLILACVGAAATMYMSVLQRVSEIALRRALGARRSDVAVLFVLEGAVVGAIGGALGALAGSLATLAIAAAQGWVAVVPPLVAPLSIGLGIVAGVLSSILPAAAASRRHPAEAIRST